jgi:cobyrinic acid a,c-diamide synthase
VRIAVARDEAFCFYYPDNFALLEQAGADLVYFSPLRDHSLPPDVDALYIGGGYPELHARSLSANGDMIASIVEFERTGKSIFAECGGFMYLCESLVDVAGDEHSMAGLLGGRTVMEKRLQAIGYREAVVETDSFLGPAGTVIRGHEFRHSRYEGDAGSPAFMVGDKPFGHRRGNIIGSYVHLHFGSNPAAARHWVEACARSMGVTEARS